MNLHHPKDHVINHRIIENSFINSLDEEMHAKRVLSLSNAAQGVLHGTSLAIHVIGHGLSVANGTSSK